MKNIVKAVIDSQRYDLSDMLRKIDTLWLQGSITDEEKSELCSLAQQSASFENSIDVIAKLTELEMRVKALEDGKTDTGSTNDYIAGKWYHNGDIVTFEGKQYTCIAPEDTVCTWSPKEYPDFWQEV